MNSLLERIFQAAGDRETESICVGPATYYELIALVEEQSRSSFMYWSQAAELMVFGKPLVVINGIPQGEIVVSSRPTTAFTGLRSLLVGS